MALNRISAPSSTPSALADWQAVVAQLATLSKLRVNEIVGSGVIYSGSLIHIGGVAYVADSDTAISGTQTKYVRVTAAGAVATAEYVASLSGVSFSAQYGGYYDSSERLHLFDEVIAVLSGAVSAARLAPFSAFGTEYFTYAKDQVLAKKLIANEYYGGPLYDGLSAGATVVASNSSPVSRTGTAYAKVRSYLSPFGGTLRVGFTLAGYSQDYTGYVYGRIYKNGVAFGTERSILFTFGGSRVSQTFSEDLAFDIGDTIELWVRTQYSAGPTGYIDAATVSVDGEAYGVWS